MARRASVNGTSATYLELAIWRKLKLAFLLWILCGLVVDVDERLFACNKTRHSGREVGFDPGFMDATGPQSVAHYLYFRSASVVQSSKTEDM